MRKVTQQAVAALLSGKKFNKGNTMVKDGKMFLHGNIIAEIDAENIIISNCGWWTVTTKERLNGLPGVSVHQKNFDWFLNNRKWDGSRLTIVNTRTGDWEYQS